MQTRIWPCTLVLLFGYFLCVANCDAGIDLSHGLESEVARNAHLKNGKTHAMTTPQIVAIIKQKDWTFTEQPFQVDPASLPELMTLCDDADPEIRELTLFALEVIPGQISRDGILKALHDEDINVRSTASRLLLTNYSKADLKALFSELFNNSDEMVRENVALTIGKIGDPFSKERLKKQAANETDLDAAHAYHLALVRLHDDENCERYSGRLQDPDPKKRVQAIQEFEYIQDRAFLQQIATLLRDEQPGLDIGPSNQQIFIRVCDVTVNVLDTVLNHPFSFEIDEYKTYELEDRLAAEEIIRNLP